MATWTQISYSDPDWAVYDDDADTLNGVTDWDGSGMTRRRFDEPEITWAAVAKGSLTWTET